MCMYYIGKAAFHLAALSGSQDIVKTLLDMKANINIQVGYVNLVYFTNYL